MSEGDDVEVLSQEVAFGGHLRVERLRLRHRQFAGGMGAPLQREVVRRGGAVAVLPYDPALDAVVLIEQFRVGAHARGGDAWLIEIVAGMIEPGETAAQVALREAREEAGLQLDELIFALEYYCSPGMTDETVAVFCAKAEARGAGGVHGLAGEGEDIRVLTMPLPEAMAALDRGRIRAGPAVVALQWLALHRDEVRRRWAAGAS